MIKRAYIGGTWDCCHAGHINLINKVIELGFKPVIIVNSDDFVNKYRKKPCIFKDFERINTLKEFYKDIDIRIVNKEEQKIMIEKINPDVIVVGTDWMKPEILPQLGIDEDFLKKNNISMLFIPRFENISTSEIKKRIKCHK